MVRTGRRLLAGDLRRGPDNDPLACPWDGGFRADVMPLSCPGPDVRSGQVDLIMIGDSHHAVENVRQLIRDAIAASLVPGLAISVREVVALGRQDGLSQVPDLLGEFYPRSPGSTAGARERQMPQLPGGSSLQAHGRCRSSGHHRPKAPGMAGQLANLDGGADAQRKPGRSRTAGSPAEPPGRFHRPLRRGPAGCGPPHPDRDPVQASRRRREQAPQPAARPRPILPARPARPQKIKGISILVDCWYSG